MLTAYKNPVELELKRTITRQKLTVYANTHTKYENINDNFNESSESSDEKKDFLKKKQKTARWKTTSTPRRGSTRTKNRRSDCLRRDDVRLQLGEETRVYLADQTCRKCKKIKLYAKQCQFQCQTQNIQDKTSTIGIEENDTTRVPISQNPLIIWNPQIQSVKRGLSSLLVIIGYHSIGYHFAPFYSYYKSNPLNWNVFVTDVCQLRSR